MITNIMDKTIRTTIYDDEDYLIDVVGELTPGSPGERDSEGRLISPDTPPEITFMDAIDQFGENIILSKSDEDKAVEALWDKLNLDME